MFVSARPLIFLRVSPRLLYYANKATTIRQSRVLTMLYDVEALYGLAVRAYSFRLRGMCIELEYGMCVWKV